MNEKKTSLKNSLFLSFRSPSPQNRFPGDGSAVLWKRDRFELVSVVGKPFDAVAPPDASAAAALGASSIAAPAAAPTGGGGGGRRGVQGLLLVTLRDKRDRGRKVVVACVHLKAKEGAANDAARAAQAREAVRALEEEASRPEGEEASAAEREREQEDDAEERRGRRRQAGTGGDPPPATVAILAGDFNAEPGSAPHEAVRASGLPLRCLWECEREEDDEEGGGGEGGEAAAAAAEAASSGGSGGNGAPTAAAAKAKGSASNNRLPPYTTYKFRSEDSESDASDGNRGARAGGAERNDATTGNSNADQLCRRVSDFVFFTPRSASAVERWAPLDFERDVKDGLPCERYPSDHAAVLAVLRPK